MRIHSALYFISIVLFVFSIASLLVVFCCLNYKLNFLPFFSAFIFSVFLSSALYFANKNIEIKFDIKSSIYAVFMSWPILILMGSIPLFILYPQMNFMDLLMISTSFSTTTGSWINLDINITNEFLIWQSTLQWLGGLLTIILATSFVEYLFAPYIKNKNILDFSNFKIVFIIYLSLTLFFISIFYFLNLPLSDCFKLAMSLISTSSIIDSYETSVFVNYNNDIMVAMIFGMFLGSLSVSLHYKAFKNGINTYLKDKSVIIFILLCIFSYFLLSIFSDLKYFENFLINKVFIIFSMISTTGYIPFEKSIVEHFSSLIFFFILLTLIGGSTCSTAGGIKVSRLTSVVNYIFIELYHLAHPREILSKEKWVKSEQISLISLSIIIYIFIIFVFSLFYTLIDLDFKDSIFIVISLITNSGIGLLELVSIQYYPDSNIEAIVAILVMLFGRIEAILVMMFFSSIFWLES